METKYKDQTHETLGLGIIYGAADFGPLHILTTESLEWNDCIVDFGVLGASHFVSLSTPQGLVNELFSCEPLPTGMSHYYPFVHMSQMPIVLSLPYNSLQYSFAGEIYQTAQEVLDRYEALEKNGRNTWISSFYFPQADNSPFDAKTTIRVCITDKDELLIQTAHGYPNENIIVFTNTTIKKTT